jgi:hypothetical protein
VSDPHADRRDAKAHKKRHGMRVAGLSIKTVIVPIIVKKGKQAKKK